MPIHFTGSYTQNFDTLATTGTSNSWENDVTLPGWSLFSQSAGTAVTIYRADSGTSNTGAFYSYGNSGADDRALGGIGSGSFTGWIAFAATNTTGLSLDTIRIEFNGEQWRNSSNDMPHTMVLEYGFGATFDAVTTWYAPGGAFDWTSPIAVIGAAALDGNGEGRVTDLGGDLTRLNWADGATLWLRWAENNDPGSDHGLAIDDFSLQALVAPPTLDLSVSSSTGREADTTVITVTATASRPVTGDQTVNLDVTGTRITADDYILSNTTITIRDGQSTGTVTLTLVDDAQAEGEEIATLTLNTPSPGVTLGSSLTQAITITDNDTPGITLTPEGDALSVTEGGSTARYRVVLNSQPTANVTLTLVSDPQEITTPTHLTFTPTNWNVAQTVTIRAIDDAIVEGNHSSTITHTVRSDDANYDTLVPDSVTVLITDNDRAGFTLSQSALTVSETGTTDRFTVTLNRQPTSNVIVQVSSRDQGEATVAPTALTFTATNWNIPQTVTVTGVDDRVVDGNQTSMLTLNVVAGQQDEAFIHVSPQTVLVTTLDNDRVMPASGPTPGANQLQGTAGADIIRARAGHDQVQGLGGNDRLFGDRGNDRLDGGQDHDTLFGGHGHDTLLGSGGRDLLVGNANNDYLEGGVDHDTLFGGHGFDTLLGGAGHDRLGGNEGRDRLDGGAGNDTLYGGMGDDIGLGGSGHDRLEGNRDRDRLFGDTGNDTLFGGTGDDTLVGGSGNDRLDGQVGNDVLNGGSGDDWIRGGWGQDVIFTGTGRDRIFLEVNQGRDRVRDFADGLDRIVLGSNLRFEQLTIQQHQRYVFISRGNQQLLLLENIQLRAITRADFVEV